MKHWINIAAERGSHDAMFLKKAQLEATPDALAESKRLAPQDFHSPKMHVQLIQYRSRQEARAISMDHIEGFEVYSGGDLESIKNLINAMLAQGRDIESILGLQPLAEGSEPRLPVLHWAA